MKLIKNKKKHLKISYSKIKKKFNNIKNKKSNLFDL